jgi:hypothetical protein
MELQMVSPNTQKLEKAKMRFDWSRDPVTQIGPRAAPADELALHTFSSNDTPDASLGTARRQIKSHCG